MKFCQAHWDALRAAVDARGLSALVADTGEQAGRNMARELEGDRSVDSFDPLMHAHWAIASNAMDVLKDIGASPLAMLGADPEHPERECPIGYLNWLSADHDTSCTEPSCRKPRGLTFDDWIDKAADGAKAEWQARAQ